MEVPLTPMEFARRARRLYADRLRPLSMANSASLTRNSSSAVTVGRRCCATIRHPAR